jgi:uncharacterized membrane protein
VTEVHGFVFESEVTVKEVAHGNNTTFGFSLVNLGNHPDTIEVTFPNAGDLAGWNITCDPTAIIDLAAFQGTGIEVLVEVPQSTLADNYTVTIKATLASDGTSKEIDLTVVVLPDFKFDLTSDVTQADAEPPTTVAFEITITNNGNIEDVYDLVLTGLPETWNTEMNGFVVVSPYGFATVTLEVMIEDEKTLGGLYNITVKAVSRGSNESKEVKVSVYIALTYGVDVACKEDKLNILPSGTANFTCTVENLGNSPLLYDLYVLRPEDSNWSFKPVKEGIMLDAWATEERIVSMTSPESTRAGTYSFHVTAQSRVEIDGGTIFDIEGVKVVVAQVYGVELYVLDGGAPLETKAGESFTVQYTITNLGNDKDQFTMSVDLPTGWTAEKEDPVELDMDEVHKGKLVITVPKNSKGGEFEYKLTATSKGDPNVEDTSTLVMKVKEKAVEPTTVALDPGLLAAIIAIIVVAIIISLIVLMKMRARKDALPPPEIEETSGPTSEQSVPEPSSPEEVPPPQEPPQEPPQQPPLAPGPPEGTG